MDINKHGIKGKLYFNGIFIPKCCDDCKHCKEEYPDNDDSTAPPFVYCNINIFFPTKKGTCKKQLKW